MLFYNILNQVLFKLGLAGLLIKEDKYYWEDSQSYF